VGFAVSLYVLRLGAKLPYGNRNEALMCQRIQIECPVVELF
jgi:hypothetical protein